MRIGILVDPGSPWSRQIVLRLAECGFEVHVLCFPKGRSGETYLSVEDPYQQKSLADFRERVTLIHLLRTRSSGLLRYLEAAPRAARVLREHKIQFLLTVYGGGHALLAYTCGFRPYSVYVVGSDILCQGTLQRMIGRQPLRRAKRIFANGEYLAAKTKETVPGADVVPLLYGVDPERFRPVPPPLGPIRIVTSRGFLPVYNNEYLVRALIYLPEVLPEFEVHFLANGPLLGEVRALADRILPARIAKRVHFSGGVSEDQLIESLHESHIFVSLSRSEGTSTALLEAMACGLFPIVSDIPQNREWISEKQENGIVVPLDQPSILAQALLTAMTSPAQRERASRFNRAQILARADGRRNVMKLAEHIRQLI